MKIPDLALEHYWHLSLTPKKCPECKATQWVSKNGYGTWECDGQDNIYCNHRYDNPCKYRGLIITYLEAECNLSKEVI